MSKWVKGQSGNPQGRPAGIPNHATSEVREWSRSILEDAQVRDRTLQQARAGKLAPAIVTELYARAYGKVKDVLDIQRARPLIVELLDDADCRPKSDA